MRHPPQLRSLGALAAAFLACRLLRWMLHPAGSFRSALVARLWRLRAIPVVRPASLCALASLALAAVLFSVPAEQARAHTSTAGYHGEFYPLHAAVLDGVLASVSHFIDEHEEDIVNQANVWGDTPLHLASNGATGHVTIAATLIAAGANVNATNFNSNTPLHFAAEDGHASIVSLLIAATASLDLKNRGVGRTPLYLAARNGHVFVVSMLIAAKASLDVQDKYGDTPLHQAANYGRVSVADMLIAAGANLDVKNNGGDTPLYWAVFSNEVSIASALIAEGADVHAGQTVGFLWTPLLLAASKGRASIADMLIAAGATLDVRDRDNNTPLHLAAANGRAAAVAALLAGGADVNLKNDDGETPLHLAADGGHAVVVTALIAAEGADVNLKNNNDETPLHYAAAGDHAAVVAALLAAGGHWGEACGDPAVVNVAGPSPPCVSVEICKGLNQFYDAELSTCVLFVECAASKILYKDANDCHAAGAYPLHAAVNAGDLTLVNHFIAEHQGNVTTHVNRATGSGATPLHYAANAGHAAIAAALIAGGADVNLKNDDDETPLYWAAGGGHAAIVAALLAAGADVNLKNDEGQTPLHWAARNGRAAVVVALLAGGAEVNAKDDNGEAPLHLAADGGHAVVVTALIAARAEVNAKNDDGEAPLHMAADGGHAVVVTALLAAEGADVNAKNGDGEAPLHMAAGGGHAVVVTALLAAEGADVNAKNNDDERPLHLAADGGHAEVVAALIAAGGYWGEAACVSGSVVNLAGPSPPCVSVEVCEGLNQFYDAALSTCVPVAVCDSSLSEVLYAGVNDCHVPFGLHAAAEAGDLDIVNHFITVHRANVNGRKPSNGFTPLHIAAYSGHVSVAAALLAAGANVSLKTNGGATPLHRAVEAGHPSVVALLISADADVNAAFGSNSSRTPLVASESHSESNAEVFALIVDLLIAAGGHWGAVCQNEKVVNPAGSSPACVCPSSTVETDLGVCESVAVCASPSELNETTNRCDCDSPNVGENGAEEPGNCVTADTARCREEDPPQFYSETDSECVAFVECASPSERNDRTNLCDCSAPYYGMSGVEAPGGDCALASKEVCEELGQFYDAALSACVLKAVCDSSSSEVLYDKTNDCHAAGGLFAAVEADDLDLVNHFITVHMSDVNARRDTQTPLHWAASYGRALIAAALISAGANVNAGTRTNSTPLSFAAEGGYLTIVAALLAAGANVDAQDSLTRGTPLYWAVFYGHLDIVATLLAEGADVNLKAGPDGNTPLHWAVSNGRRHTNDYSGGNLDVIAALLAAGADVNAKNSVRNRTPLARAAAYGKTAVYPALIAAGGHWGTACENGNVVNPAGNSPPCECPSSTVKTGLGACEAVAICAFPSVYNVGTNRCDCFAPNVGADGAVAPGRCFAPSADVCGILTPAQFYDAAARACVPVAKCAVPSVLNPETNLCDCPMLNAGSDGADAPGVCLCPAGKGVYQGACAACPDDWSLENGICVPGPAVIAAANMTLLAEVSKTSPSLAVVRRALGEGANPNITTSAGIPVLVVAATLLHADVVSVLITAGANPSVKVAGIFHDSLNQNAAPRFIPEALIELSANNFRRAGLLGRRTAETFIHFGDAAGDGFDWQAASVGGKTGEAAFSLAAWLHRRIQADVNYREDAAPPLETVMRYLLDRGALDRGAACPAFNLYDGVAVPPHFCARPTCSAAASGKAYSCSICAGHPLRALDGGSCVSQCEPFVEEADTTTWPDSQCVCAHEGDAGASDCLSEADAALIREVRASDPSLATVRALLDRRANPNVVSGGVPLLVVAATLLRAEMVSVLVTAGADPTVKVAGVAHTIYNPDGLSRSIPEALPELGFHGRAPVGRQMAETFVHFGNAAGGRFDWHAAGINGGTVGTLAFGLLEALRLRAEAASPPDLEALPHLQAMARHLASHGVACPPTANPYGNTPVSDVLCNCPAGRILDGGQCVIDPAVVAAANATLAAQITIAWPGAADLAAAREALAAGANPNLTVNGRPGLLAAGRNGHAKLVSVLVTAGANVNATDPTFLNADVVQHAASALNAPAAGPRALRASVLYYFGGGLDVRNAAAGGAKFDWNREDANGNRALDLLAHSEDESPRPDGEDASVIYQMADYMLTRGANCGGKTADKTRRVCVGDTRISDGRASLLAEVKKARDVANVSVVLRLLDDRSVSPDTEDLDGTPILIVAATIGHAEIVSVLITAGADPEARLRSSICDGSSIGRAVPHLTAQNNFGSALYYTWGTALTVLRHFADAVRQVGASYGWNADGVDLDCAAESRAMDFLRPRYDEDDASLPEESVDDKRTAMGRMAGVLIANGASCENQANKDHVTCAGPPSVVTVEYGANPPDQSGGTLTASVLSGGTTPYGARLTFTAMTANGWEFSAWQGDAAACPSSDLECVVAANGDLRVTALFSPAPSVRYAAEPSIGGSVTVAGTDGVANDVAFVYSGRTVIFTATPVNGWEISDWAGDAAACPSSDLECAIEANGNLWVTARFSTAPSVRYAAEPSSGGTVTITGTDGVANSVAFVYSGRTATFTALPANGWEVLAWEGDAACPPSDWECAVEASGNLWVTARFSPAPRARHAFEPSSGGTVTITGTDGVANSVAFVYSGRTATFTAIPENGWEVSVWAGDAAACPSSDWECAIEAEANNDLWVTARFSPAPRARHASEPSSGGRVTITGADGVAEGVDFVYSGGTVTFTAIPADGWGRFAWLGDCAGAVGDSCALMATQDVSVGATFRDINECAISADNCAAEADGGRCANTEGGFACSCVSGYSGDGVACHADKTVSFLPSAHGTLSAEGAKGEGIEDGETTRHGTTITFTANPDPGYQVSVWLGACAGTAATVASCKATATVHVSAGATFKDINECEANTDNCAAEADGGLCTNTDGGFTCGCLPGYSGKEQVCRANKTISFLPSAHGTLSAEGAGVSIQDGGAAAHGTTVTITAKPDPGYQVSVWLGACAGTAATVASCKATATVHVSAGATFKDINECEANTDNCAAEADGGVCTNTDGGFICGCLPGYSGKEQVCRANKTISFLPSAHGTLSAEGAGISIQDGGAAAHGTTITFTAKPDPGYQVSVWLGACAGTAATVASCKATATVHVSAGAAFKDINECEANTDNCAAEADGGVCTNTDGGFTCGCLPGYSGDGVACHADKIVSFLPSAHGTLSAEGAKGGGIEDGETTRHGTTITFTAKPDPGYQVSVWLGVCAGTAATVTSCEATATVHVSAGATFKDINECEANTDNCAAEADGGVCTNTDGGFTCGCLPGYSGKEQVCRANKTISFLPSAHGTLSAEGAGISIQDGGAAAHGTTITFTAKPDPGYQVSVWLGVCAGTAATVAYCKAAATVHVSAGAAFKDINECEANTDNCAAEADGGLCTNTDGGFTCGCLPGYSGKEQVCRANKTISFLPSAHGTLFAESAGVTLRNGDTAAHGTTITFTAAPDAGYQLSMWTGDCDGTFVDASAGSFSCEAAATVDVSVGATFVYTGRCAVSGHLLFGAPRDLRCAPPTVCPANYPADNDCLPAAPGLNPPRLPDAANEPNACARVFGGRMRTAGGGQAICSNIDRNDTFCIVGSRAAFPCRGLFKHVWTCNTDNRPALNPFFCGERCAGGANMARGRECGQQTLDALQSADDIADPQKH